MRSRFRAGTGRAKRGGSGHNAYSEVGQNEVIGTDPKLCIVSTGTSDVNTGVKSTRYHSNIDVVMTRSLRKNHKIQQKLAGPSMDLCFFMDTSGSALDTDSNDSVSDVSDIGPWIVSTGTSVKG